MKVLASCLMSSASHQRIGYAKTNSTWSYRKKVAICTCARRPTSFLHDWSKQISYWSKKTFDQWDSFFSIVTSWKKDRKPIGILSTDWFMPEQILHGRIEKKLPYVLCICARTPTSFPQDWSKQISYWSKKTFDQWDSFFLNCDQLKKKDRKQIFNISNFIIMKLADDMPRT